MAAAMCRCDRSWLELNYATGCPNSLPVRSSPGSKPGIAGPDVEEVPVQMLVPSADRHDIRWSVRPCARFHQQVGGQPVVPVETSASRPHAKQAGHLRSVPPRRRGWGLWLRSRTVLAGRHNRPRAVGCRGVRTTAHPISAHTTLVLRTSTHAGASASGYCPRPAPFATP